MEAGSAALRVDWPKSIHAVPSITPSPREGIDGPRQRDCQPSYRARVPCIPLPAEATSPRMASL